VVLVGLNLTLNSQTDYKKTDSIVVLIVNLINIVMAALFAARIFVFPQIVYFLGIVAMMLGFALGYIAFFNKKRKRDKWETYLLIPIFLFFVIDLVLDYVLAFDFRSISVVVGPYILLYYVGLWGLVGYSFRFEKKWGFVTLATYFLNMVLSVLAHYV